MIWSSKPINLSGEIFTYGMAVVFKKFSMSSGERQRKTRVTWKDQKRSKRYLRAGAHERNNSGTEDVQLTYIR